jgi:NOL1/NOP2/fmu family ribosome biogenesis protein
VGGWTLVVWNGWPLGWGRGVSGTLKNHYPKGLRTMRPAHA